MHVHSSTTAVFSLPDPPLQWFILVFRTLRQHWRSFSHSFSVVSTHQTMTRRTTLGRAFSLHGAVPGTIVMPYRDVLSILLLHIRMLCFNFILLVAYAVTLSV